MSLTFGRLLKELRIRKRLTQEEAATKLGIAQSQYSRAENGAWPVRAFEIDDYADTYSVDPVEFYRRLRHHRDQVEALEKRRR